MRAASFAACDDRQFLQQGTQHLLRIDGKGCRLVTGTSGNDQRPAHRATCPDPVSTAPPARRASRSTSSRIAWSVRGRCWRAGLPPNACAMSIEDLGQPVGRFVEDERARLLRELHERGLACARTWTARSPRTQTGPLAGPTPTARHRGAGSWNGDTLMPASRARRTSSNPGSLSNGVPASETRATASPAAAARPGPERERPRCAHAKRPGALRSRKPAARSAYAGYPQQL